MSQKHRSSIFQALVPILGEEEAEALLGEFPGTEIDQLATKGDVALSGAMLRTEMAELRTELRAEMADLRAELRTEIAELRTEMRGLFRQHTIWFAGMNFVSVGMAATIASLIG